MKPGRYPPLSAEFIRARLRVDLDAGRVFWRDATKYHPGLVGKEAGGAREGHHGKSYWVVKINRLPYRRAHLILTVKSGAWPKDQVDHKDGDSLNDRSSNLRAATQLQNAWNHKGRARRILLPMGVRYTALGRYQARIGVRKRMRHLGTFSTIKEAVAAYRRARRKFFGEFA